MNTLHIRYTLELGDWQQPLMQTRGTRSNRAGLMVCTGCICVKTWSIGSALTFMCPGELAGPDTLYYSEAPDQQSLICVPIKP